MRKMTYEQLKSRAPSRLVVAERFNRQTSVAVGFDPKGLGHSHWYHQQLDLPIEIPDNYLFGSPDRVTELDVDGSMV